MLNILMKELAVGIMFQKKYMYNIEKIFLVL